MTQGIIILDFGSQYNQLIGRRVRELGVYSEILPFHTPIDEILSHQPSGIILSGGPSSVNAQDAHLIDKKTIRIRYSSAWNLLWNATYHAFIRWKSGKRRKGRIRKI
jgi:GMP synthase-like glutamine amidotransferase